MVNLWENTKSNVTMPPSELSKRDPRLAIHNIQSIIRHLYSLLLQGIEMAPGPFIKWNSAWSITNGRWAGLRTFGMVLNISALGRQQPGTPTPIVLMNGVSGNTYKSLRSLHHIPESLHMDHSLLPEMVSSLLANVKMQARGLYVHHHDSVLSQNIVRSVIPVSCSFISVPILQVTLGANRTIIVDSLS
jgi:hypothetical protein